MVERGEAEPIDETRLLPSGGTPRLCRDNFVSLHRIECRICFAQELLYGFPVVWIDCDAYADVKFWSIGVIGNAFTDTSCHQVGRLCISLRQDNRKLVAPEARGSIDVPATGAQNIGHPAKCLASYHVSVAVVDSFQSVHVKEQQGKFPVGTVAALDFRVEHIHQAAIVGQAGQRIAGCLPAEVILQLSLPGDVFDDDLVGFQLSFFAEDFSSTEPDLPDCPVSPHPFCFYGIDESSRAPLTQQLCSSVRVLNNVARKLQP